MPAQGHRISLSGGVNFSDFRSQLKPGELSIARNCHYKQESPQLVKVQGRRLLGTTSDGEFNTGLDYVRFTDAGAFLIAGSGESIYTAPLSGAGIGAFTSRASGLKGGGSLEALYFNGSDRAYIVDGKNRMQVWDGSGATRNAGGLIPAAMTITKQSNSGETKYISGTSFSFCYTEYDPTNDVESPPSSVVRMATTLKGDTFRLTFPATSTNGGAFTKIRLYRTQFGGPVFYRLAEFTYQASIKYYDGVNTEAGSPAVVNDDIWGFDTIDDILLSTQPVLSMVGEPLRSNYITTNGIIPLGQISFLFENSLVITGIPSFPQDVYYSQSDFPENFSPADFVREENERGEPVTGGGVANDRMIIFTTNHIFRHNTLPRVTDPGFGLGEASREEVTKDHGCVAKRTIVNFGIGQPNNRLFYLSSLGPMMTDGYETFPLGDDLGWDSRLYNFGSMGRAVAKAYPKYHQIRLFVPSSGSVKNDICMIYHYHPNHVKRGRVGKWTGPVHVRCADAAVVAEVDSESRIFIADTNSSGKIYEEDVGTKDEQFYENSDGDIHWEWETGDHHMEEESRIKKFQRVFLNVLNAVDFTPSLKFAINKNDEEHSIVLANQSRNLPRGDTFGSSTVKRLQTRSYRGGIWQAASHLRLHMDETAKGEREVASVEVEVSSRGGRQR